jgi:co-chaperonin GroES (HSP10)
MAIAEPAIVIEYGGDEDPRQKVLDIIMPMIEGIELYRNEVLLVTAPNRTMSSGGIYIPEGRKTEQRWQGKTGLVVALGEIAFQDDKLWPDAARRPKVGDWVLFATPNAPECSINGYSCRFIDDDKVRGRCSAPDSVR